MTGYDATFDPSLEPEDAHYEYKVVPDDDRLDLAVFLLQEGVPVEEVARAQVDGTLPLLAMEQVLVTSEPLYDLDEVSAMSGLRRDVVAAHWRALGFPEPRHHEKVFSDTDLEMLASVVAFIDDTSVDAGLALQMSRVIGSSMERVANSQVDAIEGRGDGLPLDGLDEHDRRAILEAVDTEAVRRGAELLPMMPKVMEFTWRRHLASTARRRRLRVAQLSAPGVCVGFADLVGFTSQTQQLDERELADVVTRFEAIAYDVVQRGGGRVVKMIGDEVMFVAETPKAGADIALGLAEAFRNDENLSDVRVGLAFGSVLEREGDVYGHTVNLASRITSVAYPGAVVVGEHMYEALAGDESYGFHSIRSHFLKDVGRVRLWSLRRPGEELPERYERARARRSQRTFLFERRRALLERKLGDGLPDDLGEVTAMIAADDSEVGEPTEEFEAITDAVLAADIDPDLQVELLVDLETSRRFAAVERQAREKAVEVDLEAERQIEQIEADVRRKVHEAEAEAQRKVQEALSEAEARAARANEDASRKVRRVADEAERRATQAEKDARRAAKRRAEKRKAEQARDQRDDDRKKNKK
jgi:adenylate cyclase